MTVWLDERRAVDVAGWNITPVSKYLSVELMGVGLCRHRWKVCGGRMGVMFTGWNTGSSIETEGKMGFPVRVME